MKQSETDLDDSVNSREWWEKYFALQWDANGGTQQTRHFMERLLASLPERERSYLAAKSWEILDWGCAFGEGVDTLAHAFPLSRIAGLDFAQTAVEEARRRYPAQEFIHTPSGDLPRPFDVIVTSNCLEHFERPLEVMTAQLPLCRKLYIALVPYQEEPLFHSHRYRFDARSFPETLGGFVRVALEVVEVEPSIWAGHQVLVAYGSEAYLQEQGLSPERAIGQARLAGLQAQVAQVEKAAEDLRTQLRVENEQTAGVLAGLRADVERIVQLLQTEHQRAVQYLRAEHERTLQHLQGDHERAVRALQADYERTLQAVQQDRQQAQAALIEKVTERDEHIAQLEAQLAAKDLVITERSEAVAWLLDELELARSERDRMARSKFWRLGMAYWTLRARLLRAFWPLRHPFQWLAGFWLYWRVRGYIKRALLRTLPRPLAEWVIARFQYRPPIQPVAIAPAATTATTATTPELSALTEQDDVYANLTLLPAPLQDELARLDDYPALQSLQRQPDIICFSIIDWSFRYQRPQQIMSQFAAHGHRVFYLNVTQFLPPDAVPAFTLRVIKENVYEVVLSAQRPPAIYEQVIAGENQVALLSALEALCRACNINEAIGYIMKVSWGNVAFEARRRWGWRIIYDCMDEWENFPGIQRAILDMEPRVVRECDLLVVTAQRLYDKWQDYQRPMVLARNGVDFDFYAARLQPNDLLPGVNHPIVGYYGAIADWFDVDLMAHVARERPEYTFILLGGVFDVDVSKLRALTNVRLLGQQPYETMPHYLYHFDVCLIPFKVNPITEATDPVKLYEYLSAGKPVVSVALSEVEPYRDYIYLARNRDEFVAQLDAAVAEDDAELVARRKALAQQNTWAARYEAIRANFTAIVPRASIIIVTYNNLVLTRLCLASILRNTEYANYEIIVVDNCSTDGTPAYLRSVAEQCPHLTVILNSENKGFAHANNQGLQQATGSYLVLLNNDTVVPPGWLSRLLRHLDDPAIGLVGPVTNFVGNEAKVAVGYQTWREMEAFARQYTWDQAGKLADIHVLAMYCVAMRRDTFEDVGLLDEQFGIGMFEDDDYAMRVRQQGYRVACALDVFVHHFGQSAFKALIQNGTYDPLFDENRRRYEGKWKIQWVPHRHAPLQPIPGTFRAPPAWPAPQAPRALPLPASQPSAATDSTYAESVLREKQKWGSHLLVEASGEWNAWLDHPLIAEHYRERSLIEGLRWEEWVAQHLGGPAERSLDLGCGAGERSLTVWKAGSSQHIEGIDISDDRIAEGERRRQELGAPGRFWVDDLNTVVLPENTYDLIFSCHSFHHFMKLEHVMEQVVRALTERGLFILEEFVGPTQFQWTNQQLRYTQDLLGSLPESLRRYRSGTVKAAEGRPTPAEVVAVSPFESIRSAEIWSLFQKYFSVVAVRKLGGTIQHLLYNGIVHNFSPDQSESATYIRSIYEAEDRLVDTGQLPSDFMLLVGKKPR